MSNELSANDEGRSIGHADTKKSWKLKNLKNFNLIFSKCDDGKNRGGGSVGGEQQSHIMIISSNPL